MSGHTIADKINFGGKAKKKTKGQESARKRAVASARSGKANKGKAFGSIFSKLAGE